MHHGMQPLNERGDHDPIWLRKPKKSFPLRVGDFFGRARAGALLISSLGAGGGAVSRKASEEQKRVEGDEERDSNARDA